MYYLDNFKINVLTLLYIIIVIDYRGSQVRQLIQLLRLIYNVLFIL